MTNSGRDLKDMWASMRPEACAVEECPKDGNVLLTLREGPDVWMCAKHADEELEQ